MFARLRWIVPAAFLVVVAWLLWHEVGEFPLPDIQKTLLDVPTASAIGVGALAVFAVMFTGVVDWLIGRWLKLGLSAREYLRLAFIANGMANTLNLSGAMGASIRLMGLSSHKVPLSRAAALIGMQALSLMSGLSLLVIVTLATSSLPMSSGTPQHWIAAVVLTLSALYLPLYFVLTTRRALMRWLPADVGVPPLQLKIQLTLISFVDWVLAAATLYACIYLSGEHVKPGLLLGAFAGAGVLGLVSQVPGGLGVFDGLILLALTDAGYDKASVFSGLMLFRISYYLLPLFGSLYLGSEMLTQRLPLLKEMYEGWRFFRATLDNLEMVLAKSDMAIAERYAALAGDEGAPIFARIRDGWQRTHDLLLEVSGQSRLLENNPALDASIRLRLPYIEPLNLLQIELIKRHRAGETDPRISEGIQLSINAIATALRNSG